MSDTPAFIDYEDDPESDPPSRWTHSTFKNHWYKEFTGQHGRKPRWGVKESTLLNKLIAEYDARDLSEMMVYFVNASEQEFNIFYVQAADFHEKIKGWSWN